MKRFLMGNFIAKNKCKDTILDMDGVIKIQL